jgi:hypothetical protein
LVPVFLNGLRHLYLIAQFLFLLNCDRRVSRLWLFPPGKIFVASTIWAISGALPFFVATTMQAWGGRPASQ